MATDDNIVSTDYQDIPSTIHVYPNPTNGLVQIRAGETISNIDITDLQGRTLLNFDVREKDFSFDISQVPVGVYFMRIIIEQNIWIEKIIKGE